MKRYSIRIKLGEGILIMLILLLSGLMASSFQSARAVRQQAVSLHQRTGAMIMEQIDYQLSGAEAQLKALTETDYNLRIIQNSLNQDEIIFANVRFQSALSTTLASNQLVGSFFLYNQMKDEYWDVYNSNTQFGQRETLRRYIQDTLMKTKSDSLQYGQWFACKVEGEYYLFDIHQYGNLHLGAWVSARSIQDSLGNAEEGIAYFLIDDEGTVLTETSVESDFPSTEDYTDGSVVYDTDESLLVANHSRTGDFALAVCMSNERLQAGMPKWFHFVFWGFLSVAVMFPLMIVFFHKAVSRPVDSMVRGFSRFGQGDTTVRFEENEKEGEFCALKHAFNQMAEQIERLKIHVYEEQLERQKAELQYLEMQTNPHFFVNALNSIYAFAVANDMSFTHR
ncbi:sensor histidine kinase [Ruthenibacterium lactatiformans]|jgi:hypothetical protein|uniref:sensor histidine kinase n=1 Tax=Ruthenibacterium lactatiformans TaxID=1550024 RepID=UPI0026660D5F|nr:sensor histidine kinase [Ruthenibacterium lactatiformans]